MGIIVLLVLLGVVVIAGLAVAIFGPKDTKDQYGDSMHIRAIGGVVAGVAVLAGAIVLLFSTATTVGPSDVGIEVAFGKTVGDLGPGFHFVAPQNNVVIWPGNVQTITYGRDLNQAKADHCLQVRIGGQQTACLAMTFQYQLRLSSSDKMFKLYRSFGNMNDKLVVRSLDQAANTQLQNFSPIEAAAKCGGSATCPGESLVPFQDKILAQMRGDIGADIVVEHLFIPFAAYDAQTQARLNSIQNQSADTLIAAQQITTNQKLAAANRALAASVSNDPAVIAANCLQNVLIPLVKAGIDPNPGLCPSAGGSGSSNTVVVTK